MVGKGDNTQFTVNVGGMHIGTPSGVVQSKNGDLYFTEPNQHVVLKAVYDKDEGTWSNVVIVAGTGDPDMGDDNTDATLSALKTPVHLSLIEDDAGEVIALIIVDRGNHRIRKVDMTSTPKIITTIAGNGQQGDSGDSELATSAKLNNPNYAYYDKSSGDIFVADMQNHKIRRIFKSDTPLRPLRARFVQVSTRLAMVVRPLMLALVIQHFSQ